MNLDEQEIVLWTITQHACHWNDGETQGKDAIPGVHQMFYCMGLRVLLHIFRDCARDIIFASTIRMNDY